jgi:[acyl-carrier-protein] S-malonyltransferase
MAKLALVFPGQGSQAVGMGREIATEFEAAGDVFKRAAEVLDYDVATLCFKGPEDELNRTDRAQLALYVSSMAAAAVLVEKGIEADVVSGHSLGEYSALAFAGAVDFDEGLRLVAHRGQVMQQAASRQPGAMAAILGLDDALVEEICSGSGEVWPVNYNCPGQLVISGEQDAVARAMTQAEAAGAKKTIALKVSGSFHSPLMREAADAMEQRLAKVTFKEPEPPFLSSISCEYEGAGSLGGLLVKQMVSPVRWRQAVERLVADGVDRFIEVGNGKVLTGLIRRIDGNVDTAGTGDPKSLRKALTTL